MLAEEFKPVAVKLIIDLLGWIGSGCILLAYASTLLEEKKYLPYATYLNLVGGIFVAINCYYYRALPSFTLNIIWCVIALITIYKSNRERLRKMRFYYLTRRDR